MGGATVEKGSEQATGRVTSAFNPRVSRPTPQSELAKFEKQSKVFAERPVPMKEIAGNYERQYPAKIAEQKEIDVEKHLNEKGELDQKGYIEWLAEKGNKRGDIEVSKFLVDQASATLKRLGIDDDENHTIATGLAKEAVAKAEEEQNALKRRESLPQQTAPHTNPPEPADQPTTPKNRPFPLPFPG
ncbi:MAG TPA: hypothetical protein VL625_06030 [Patescibacteria group bacterium]|nr:hypothetical protein [Patescibacteria group bacterium]